MKHPVYWIGGSYSGVKTTTRRLLVERHDIEDYPFDNHILQDPIFTSFLVENRAWFWLPNEGKLDRYRGAFPLAVDQIEALAATGPVLVEGPGLLPELLSRIGVLPEKALHLLPTPEFQRIANRQRGKWVDEALSLRAHDPDAWERWMTLDEQFANLVERSAANYGYRVIRNDGTKSPEEVATIAEQHFGFREVIKTKGLGMPGAKNI